MTEARFVHPLVHFQKPTIGSTLDDEDPPVQIVFPEATFCLGIAAKGTEGRGAQAQQERGGFGILSSSPVNDVGDLGQKQQLGVAFIGLCIANIVLTTLLYNNAKSVDLSLVELGHGPLPSVFEAVHSERRAIENTNFGFVILLQIIGMLSVIFESTVGISAYSLGITLNFVLSVSSLPYYLYSFRFLLDLAMLYIGLVFRSRLMVSFLPIQLQHNQ